jgi:hypothetical protein
MNVTVFKNSEEIKTPYYFSIDKILSIIKNGKDGGFVSLIKDIREMPDGKIKDSLKQSLPSIMFSASEVQEVEVTRKGATYKSLRTDKSVAKHSGFMCLDFDKFKTQEDLDIFKDSISSIKYIYAYFVSPSGNGLKVIVRVTPEIENHRGHFMALKDVFNHESWDNSSINISRLCFMSYDPDMYINPDAEVFLDVVDETMNEPLESKKISPYEVVSSNDIISALHFWWSSKYGLVDGQRNRNVFILASALNEFGVPEIEAKNFCYQFVQSDFDEDEISNCISSAYSKTHLFGSKVFDKTKKVEEQVHKDISHVKFHEMYKVACVDLSKKIKYPPLALSVGEHEFRGSMFPTQFGTFGNFSVIMGEPKSRKSFFKSLITAAFIGNPQNTQPFIKNHRLSDMFVIDLDTEQGDYDAQRAFRRVIEMCGRDYQYYKPFALRRFEPKQRLEFIEWLIYESDMKDNIGWITIDGVADLVYDFNDIKESQAVIQKIMKWTDEKQFHLNTIIHSNFGSSKATGHIGSFLQKKAETICHVVKDGGFSNVTFPMTRGYSVDDLVLTVRDGLPYIDNKGLRMRDGDSDFNF